jgi:Glu-tRNA(Gln) amidotransferase subunit E-like FAD-binding protein
MKTFNTVAEIKAEREFQRSNPVVYSLLGVLLGEIDRLPIPRTQSPSKDQIYAIVKKLYEGAELLASKDWSEEAKIEYAYLKDYIKQQLSEEEIRQIISKSGLNQIGAIMNYFKSYHSGQYDGKLVSQIAKEVSCQ